jgi:hypothetical protein
MRDIWKIFRYCTIGTESNNSFVNISSKENWRTVPGRVSIGIGYQRFFLVLVSGRTWDGFGMDLGWTWDELGMESRQAMSIEYPILQNDPIPNPCSKLVLW